jgi:hypothetical protein
MEISSNLNSVPSQTEALLPQVGVQSRGAQAVATDLISSANELEKMKAVALQLTESDRSGALGSGALGKIHEFAQAAINAIVEFVNSLTVVWEAPRPVAVPQAPQPTQTPVAAPPAVPQGPEGQPPASQAPVPLAPAAPEDTVVTTPEPVVSAPAVATAPASLLPSSARIFEFTNKSEWHPGLFNQKAYVDLRPELKGRVSSIKILSPDGASIVATGKLERVGSDGRPRFRFDRPAASIPQGAIIMANLTNNDGVRYIELDRPSRAFRW